jgi:uncharacterized protein YuzE
LINIGWREVRMKVIFDPETDTLSLILREDKIAESDEIREGIIIDYNKDGKIVSIEILDATEQISEPQGILYELKGKEKALA